MQISKLRLMNFRNFILENFEFSKHKNIIIGNNGMGKTNIIEAIYYFHICYLLTNVNNRKNYCLEYYKNNAGKNLLLIVSLLKLVI